MYFKESKAIYLQIADHLMDEILKSHFPEGQRIPSVRECAADLEVNVNTCMRAYDWLCQRRIIFTRRGLGYFVSEGASATILEELREEFFHETLPEVIDRMRTLHIDPQLIIDALKADPA